MVRTNDADAGADATDDDDDALSGERGVAPTGVSTTDRNESNNKRPPRPV